MDPLQMNEGVTLIHVADGGTVVVERADGDVANAAKKTLMAFVFLPDVFKPREDRVRCTTCGTIFGKSAYLDDLDRAIDYNVKRGVIRATFN
ncbi:MAG TPA: hypothetical protein VGU66_18790 [Candidatus Elarobacter sp.]|nr:hypothetical protein [Candidatus Elarobacter sp.]